MALLGWHEGYKFFWGLPNRFSFAPQKIGIGRNWAPAQFAFFVNGIFCQFSLSLTKSSYFCLFYQTNFSKMVINTQEHCFWGPRTITISKI